MLMQCLILKPLSDLVGATSPDDYKPKIPDGRGSNSRDVHAIHSWQQHQYEYISTIVSSAEIALMC
jgi:hypothetical protein